MNDSIKVNLSGLGGELYIDCNGSRYKFDKYSLLPLSRDPDTSEPTQDLGRYGFQ